MKSRVHFILASLLAFSVSAMAQGVNTKQVNLGANVGTALQGALNATGGLVGYSGALGTPTSGTLTNATGLPIATGVSGLGVGVSTALQTPLNSGGGLMGYSSAAVTGVLVPTPATISAVSLSNLARQTAHTAIPRRR